MAWQCFWLPRHVTVTRPLCSSFFNSRCTAPEPASAIEVESKLTDRYQTPVPETVRRALKLGKRDKIRYTIQPGGEVLLTRAESSDGADPVLGHFLGFLAQDMARHPEHSQFVDACLVHRLQSLIGAVEVDLDATLAAEDE